MRIVISKTADELGMRAAEASAKIINEAIAKNGRARIILSTGASQFETLEHLVKADIDWSKVEMFHLDEYVDLPETHIASFRKYLKERFVDQVKNLGKAHFVDGTAEGIAKLTEEIRKELESGSYNLDIQVDIAMLVNYNALYMVGEGRLTHTVEGFHLTGCDGKLNYTQKPQSCFSLYADYYWYEIADCICIGGVKAHRAVKFGRCSRTCAGCSHRKCPRCTCG